MGLTVFYTLHHRAPLTDPEACSLVERLRAAVRDADVQGVSRLIRVGLDSPLAYEWVDLPQPGGGLVQVDVPPDTGCLFQVTVGQDCEPLLLGLCRYPTTVVHRGRVLRTNCGAGWSLRYFCKTQYASLHGWPHFLLCHRAVIEALLIARRLGLEVKIRDRGGYWPRRSESLLRQSLGVMNGFVAATAGALKEASDAPPVQSPIFAYSQFEHLEHAGAQALGPSIEETARVIRRVAQAQ